jgi:hypothetical protein
VLVRIQAWQKAAAEFDEARLLVWAACTKETIETVNAFGVFTLHQPLKCPGSEILRSIENRDAIATRLFAVKTAVRKELGFSALFTPLSTL